MGVLNSKALWLSAKRKLGEGKLADSLGGMHKFPAAILFPSTRKPKVSDVPRRKLCFRTGSLSFGASRFLIACSDIYEVYICISVLVNQYLVSGHFDRWPWSF